MSYGSIDLGQVWVEQFWGNSGTSHQLQWETKFFEDGLLLRWGVKGRPASKAEKVLLFFEQCVWAIYFIDLSSHCSDELERMDWWDWLCWPLVNSYPGIQLWIPLHHLKSMPNLHNLSPSVQLPVESMGVVCLKPRAEFGSERV